MKKYLLSLVVLITSLSSIQGQSIDQNYVKTTVYKKGFQEEVVNMAENDEKIETVQYFDGLGRPSQSVAVRQGGNKLENNIIDWKNNWILGSGSAPFFVQNGATTENQRINGINPYEKESTLWQCTNDAVSGPDGGWNTDYFEIDNTVGYRYTVWVKRTGSQNGTTYHGTRNVNNLSGSTNTDPYFWSGDTPNLDQWYLMVGIIHPHTYTGSSTGVSGVYDMNGTRVKSGTEFKWASTTVTSSFRSYLDYSTDVNVKQYFYDPIVQRLDGNEATIDEILQGNVGKDIVTHIDYDEFGRQAKDYLSYAETTNDGLYRTDALSGTNNYYDTPKYENTQNPFSQKLFENSPLNRILEQTAPGNIWDAGSIYDTNNHSDGHTIKFTSSTNTSTTEVRLYQVNLDASYTPTLALSTLNSGYYGIGELYKSIIKDENWKSTQTNPKDHTTEEFKDKQGRVVLKRTYNDNVKHDTYYVYDDYGNLTYVLPPKMDATTNSISTINNQLDDLGYQYTYDNRNRLIEKKIPGKGKEYILYNKIDQPIITQDEVQRSKTTKEWLFTKYDVFGRVAYTGLRQYNIDEDIYRGNITATTTPVAETARTTATTIAGTIIYYNKVSIPTTVDKIYTINYYDNYNFLNSESITVPSQTSHGEAITSNTKGLTTGSKVRVLGTDYWITTVTAYDEHKRPVWVYSKNDYLGTVDIIESKLKEDSDDIRGLVHETKTTHQKSGTDIVTIDEFTYDHTGRLLSQKQKINNQSKQMIVQNNYDDLGQLVSKNVGGEVTKIRLQNVDYKYNIRGWLKQINDVYNLGIDLFSFKINYNDTEIGTRSSFTPLYNGNISETIWRTANDITGGQTRGYAYEYDALNRITYADLGIKTTASYSLSSGFDLRVDSYDKNGNIESLYRNSESPGDAMDDIRYTYDSGNKLLKVQELATSSFKDNGFKDGNTSGDDYDYDTNGNMTKDLNKGITSISYNHLNLPETVTINNNPNIGIISYIYDATGVKLQKTVNNTGESSVTITDYIGNFVYENNILQFFNQPEGYVEPEDPTDYSLGFNYIYQYKDHLGNIRLSYSDADGNGSINASTEIIEEKNYYPFGLVQKGYNNVVNGTAHPYGYAGKEEQNELGLGWLDITARNYDPAIGRWMNLDPLAEQYYSYSSYNYTLNNPIKFKDEDGNIVRDPDGNVVFTSSGTSFSAKPAVSKVVDASGNITYTVIERTYEQGNIYADNGTAIDAFSLMSATQRTVKTDKNGKILTDTTSSVDTSKYDCEADCHGKTFGDNKIWINDDQVQTILDNDDYMNTGSESLAGIVVFKDSNGNIVHSGVRNSNGTYDDNAGFLKTEYGRTLGEASRGLTEGALDVANVGNGFTGNVNFFFKAGSDKVLQDKRINNLGTEKNGVRKITDKKDIAEFLKILSGN